MYIFLSPIATLLMSNIAMFVFAALRLFKMQKQVGSRGRTQSGGGCGGGGGSNGGHVTPDYRSQVSTDSTASQEGEAGSGKKKAFARQMSTISTSLGKKKALMKANREK